MTETLATSIGFLLLVIACWPSQRMRMLSLRMLSGALRLGLLGVVAGAFLLGVWPGWNGSPATLDTLPQEWLAVPAAAQWLAGAALIVGVCLPVIAMVEFARRMSEAAFWLQQDLPQQITQLRIEPAPAPLAPVPRRELQVALDAMTAAASGRSPNRSTAPKTRTVAEIVSTNSND